MIRQRLLLLGIIALTFAPGAAHAAPMKIHIKPDALVSILSTPVDDGKYTGHFGETIFGVPEGKLLFVIENAAGKPVFQHEYNCKKKEYADLTSCEIENDDKENIKPYAVENGKHILRIFMDKKELFTFAYQIVKKAAAKTSDDDSDSRPVIYVTGDWNKMGTYEGIWHKMRVYGMTDRADCELKNVQAQLFRDGKYLASGAGSFGTTYYFGCTTSFELVSFDAKHFLVQHDMDSILPASGEYELKVFADGKPLKTYAFKVAKKQLTSTPPKGLQPALMPENLAFFKGDIWYYSK